MDLKLGLFLLQRLNPALQSPNFNFSLGFQVGILLNDGMDIKRQLFFAFNLPIAPIFKELNSGLKLLQRCVVHLPGKFGFLFRQIGNPSLKELHSVVPILCQICDFFRSTLLQICELRFQQ